MAWAAGALPGHSDDISHLEVGLPAEALHDGGVVLNKKQVPRIVFGIALHILQRASITRGTAAPA